MATLKPGRLRNLTSGLSDRSFLSAMFLKWQFKELLES